MIIVYPLILSMRKKILKLMINWKDGHPLCEDCGRTAGPSGMQIKGKFYCGKHYKNHLDEKQLIKLGVKC